MYGPIREPIVDPSKLTAYLLVSRPLDDKSQFLAQAGFTSDNPEVLLDAIRQHAAPHDAAEDGDHEWGTLLRCWQCGG
ncbi:MAG: hypothetical protein HPY44_08460 [Armatimonadetes bacterium]|nr:hypothetical protein [Armatimonadota bacterium]